MAHSCPGKRPILWWHSNPQVGRLRPNGAAATSRRLASAGAAKDPPGTGPNRFTVNYPGRPTLPARAVSRLCLSVALAALAALAPAPAVSGAAWDALKRAADAGGGPASTPGKVMGFTDWTRAR